CVGHCVYKYTTPVSSTRPRLLRTLDRCRVAMGSGRQPLRVFAAGCIHRAERGELMGLLEGKSTVITGAGRGIGKACAAVFVREGARVLAVDFSGAQKDTAAELGSAVVPFHADVSKEEDVAAMIDAAVEAFG